MMPTKLARIINPKRGDSKTIVVNDLKLLASYLGKGLFAKAYRVEDRVYLFANDPMKDAIAELRRYSGQGDNPHIPLIERVGYDDESDANIYLMPYYEPLTAKHKQAWAQARELRRAKLDAQRDVMILTRYGDGSPYDQLNIANKTIEWAKVPDALKAALNEMLEQAQSYGVPGLEFNKANLSVDKQDRLILRDILFDAELLERYRKTQQEKFMRKQRLR